MFRDRPELTDTQLVTSAGTIQLFPVCIVICRWMLARPCGIRDARSSGRTRVGHLNTGDAGFGECE